MLMYSNNDDDFDHQNISLVTDQIPVHAKTCILVNNNASSITILLSLIRPLDKKCVTEK